jgi:hypothetical protein
MGDIQRALALQSAKHRALVASNPAMREKTDDVQQKTEVAACRVETEWRRKDLQLLTDFIPHMPIIRMQLFQLAGEGPALRDRRS